MAPLPLPPSGFSGVAEPESVGLDPPPPVPLPPLWLNWTNIHAVTDFLLLLLLLPHFTVMALHQAQHSALLQTQIPLVGLPTVVKPCALDVESMYRSDMFQSGSTALPAGSHSLRAEVMAAYHVQSCAVCGPIDRVSPDCYFSDMYYAVLNGWKPPVAPLTVLPLYSGGGKDGNQVGADRYPVAMQKEISAMTAAGIASMAPADPDGVRIISAVGITIKKSDFYRAQALTRIDIVDQDTLNRANFRLAARGAPPVKTRPIIDCTGSGLNGSCVSASFQYVSLGEAIRLISQDCWIASLDIERYFHSFPLDPSSRSLFSFVYDGVLHEMNRVPFGLSPAPYYCSAWGGEVYRWVSHAGIPSSFMMDDWLTVGEDRSEAKARQDAIKDILTACGWTISHHKDQLGQQVKFKGYLIDTVAMTLSFDSDSASSFLPELVSVLQSLQSSQRVPVSTLRHLAGKLNWYAEVLQQGRSRNQVVWDAQRYSSGPLPPAVRLDLIKDLSWWQDRVAGWAADDHSSNVYPLLSASELAKEGACYFMQSDASGLAGHGFGYLHGPLVTTPDPSYVSCQWPDGYIPPSSLAGELRALEHFALQTDIRARLLVWVTDSLDAAWAINKGRCHDPAGREIMDTTLAALDQKRVTVFAVWIRREANEFPDYLSHLTSYLDRPFVSGVISSLRPQASAGAASGRHQAREGQRSSVCAVRDGLCRSAHPSIPSSVSDDRQLRHSLRRAEQGVNTFSRLDPQPSEDAVSTPRVSLAGSFSLASSSPTRQAVEVGRLIRTDPEASSSLEGPLSDPLSHGLVRPGEPHEGHAYGLGSQRPLSQRGAVPHPSANGGALHLGSRGEDGPGAVDPVQDAAQRLRGIRRRWRLWLFSKRLSPPS